MMRKARIGFGLCCFILALGLFVYNLRTSKEEKNISYSMVQGPADKIVTPAVLGTITGEMHFRDQNNQLFERKNFYGKIWVVDFFFTQCKGPCPILTQRMASLQKEFLGTKGVNFLSVTVDPENDTPEVLKAYAKKYKADPNKWYFVTGPMDQIIRLGQDVFRVSVGEHPDLHGTKFVLLDASERIRGYYDSENPDDMKLLNETIRHFVGQ